MIGTHNTYTYLKPTNPLFRPFAFLWRTQDKTLSQQKKAGATYFDIRIRYDEKAYNWRVCHGLVDLDFTYPSITAILRRFKGYKVRLVLERGNKNEEELFKSYIRQHKSYKALSFAAIKKNWQILIDKDPIIEDYSFVPFLSDLSFWQNFKRFQWIDTIKHHAKKHTPQLTQELKDDTKIHFVDYL